MAHLEHLARKEFHGSWRFAVLAAGAAGAFLFAATGAPRAEFGSVGFAGTPHHFDITFIGDNYAYADLSLFQLDAQSFRDSMMTYEPFHSRRGDILFNYIANTVDLGCVQQPLDPADPRLLLWRCDTARVMDIVRQSGVPYDKIAVMVKGETGGTGGGDLLVIGSKSQGSVFVHELGHTLGLYDEYVVSTVAVTPRDSCSANCCFSDKCVDWRDTIEGTSCIAGCTYSGWYRSTEDSLMRHSWAGAGFNAVSINHVNKMIDDYTEKIPPAAVISAPRAGEAVAGRVLVNVKVSDNRRVKKVRLYIDGALRDETPDAYVSVSGHPFYWETAGLTEGSRHTLRIQAIDAAENVGESPEVTVMIGAAVPSPVVVASPLASPIAAASPVASLPPVAAQISPSPLPFPFPSPLSPLDEAKRALVWRIRDLEQRVAELRAKREATMKLLPSPPPGTAATPAQFTKALRRGVSGPHVILLQQFLRQEEDVYPEGIMSGYFGPATEAAVKRFQVRYGLEPVGYVGPLTRQKLNELADKVSAPSAASSLLSHTAKIPSDTGSARCDGRTYRMALAPDRWVVLLSSGPENLIIIREAQGSGVLDSTGEIARNTGSSTLILSYAYRAIDNAVGAVVSEAGGTLPLAPGNAEWASLAFYYRFSDVAQKLGSGFVMKPIFGNYTDSVLEFDFACTM